MKQDIKNLSYEQLISYLKNIGEQTYRAQQIFIWLYQKNVDDFSLMRNLSGKLIERLMQDFYIQGLVLKQKIKSRDQTEKFLFKLEDNNLIESVLIPHKDRNTLCLSTQVGCKYHCEFCASGELGFVRNLTQAEILNQIIFIKKESAIDKITNIVFMGIGEPLDNYDNLLGSIRIINSKYGFNIGQRKITISTAGVIEGIKKLTKEGLQIELSISLHSADNDKRNRIMPINRKYPLNKLLPCLKEFIRLTKRKITFEYVLLGNFNTSLNDADLLIKLIKGINCKINLITFNPSQKSPGFGSTAFTIPSNHPERSRRISSKDECILSSAREGESVFKPKGSTPISKSDFTAPSQEEVSFFKSYLSKNHLDVTVRQSRGQDIEAACGQLRLYSINGKD